MEWLVLVFIGLLAGGMSGFFGIGGGIVIVPLLLVLAKYTQQQAQGTSLAVLLPPIGVAAVYQYYKRGDVNINAAVAIAAGFVIGSLLTSMWVAKVPTPLLKKAFALLLLYYAGQMVASTAPTKGGWGAWLAAGLAAFSIGALWKPKSAPVPPPAAPPDAPAIA